MSLPAYAEELKRRLDEYKEPGLADILASPTFSLLTRFGRDEIDRILRDAEIAQAAREYAAAWRECRPGYNDERDALIALIAKETP